MIIPLPKVSSAWLTTPLARYKPPSSQSRKHRISQSIMAFAFL